MADITSDKNWRQMLTVTASNNGDIMCMMLSVQIDAGPHFSQEVSDH